MAERWIRFAREKRSHAVLGTLFRTTYVTYCGKMMRMDATVEASRNRGQCAGCRTRLRNPCLVPEELKGKLDASQ